MRTIGAAARKSDSRADEIIVEVGDDDRFLDPVGLKRIKLVFEQASPVKLD